MGHLRYIWLKKIGRTRRRPLEGARTRHQRPCPLPTEAREGCPGLVGDACARQLEMVETGVEQSTADDHLTVDGDANVRAGVRQKVSAVSLGVMDYGS